jgi:hypothetical protein
MLNFQICPKPMKIKKIMISSLDNMEEYRDLSLEE